MKKIKNLTLKELFLRHKENCALISEIADKAERENRALTDKEKDDYSFMLRENQIIGMRIYTESAKQIQQRGGSDFGAADEIISRNYEKGKATTLLLFRDIVAIEDAENGGIVPLSVMDVVAPLEDKLIFQMVGLPFYTGLEGDMTFNFYSSAEAYLRNEGVAISSSNLDIRHTIVRPESVGCYVVTSSHELNKTRENHAKEGLTEMIIKTALTKAAAQLINRVVFGTTPANSATSLKGPFVDKVKEVKVIEGDMTFKDFVDMKAEVLSSGVDGDTLAWVMSPLRKAVAESTPRVPNGEIMICENNMIAGIPVYTTNRIEPEYIGFGDWEYQPTALHGATEILVNPYTRAREGNMEFHLRTSLSTKTLYNQAFSLRKVNDALTQKVEAERVKAENDEAYGRLSSELKQLKDEYQNTESTVRTQYTKSASQFTSDFQAINATLSELTTDLSGKNERVELKKNSQLDPRLVASVKNGLSDILRRAEEAEKTK